MSRLTLTRERAPWADRLRAYTLTIDGTPSGSVKNGETIEVELPPKVVCVQMKVDWATSRELQVDGRHDVALRCRAAANPFLAILWITVWKDKYIALWQPEQSAP